MPRPANTNRAWRFGVYQVDARSAELRRGGTPVRIREQCFRILVCLIENAGELVGREDLRRQLWPSDTFVDFEHSLNAAMMKLRDTLGDAAESPIYIETVPKRGYRFIAPVTHIAATEDSKGELAMPGGAAPAFAERDGKLTASANEDVRVSAKVGAEDGFRIAVLPFRWSGSESHVQSCADGFTEDIVNGLSRFSYLRVIAASSMARYRGCALDLRAAREEIEARYLLEGSLRQAGARVRLVAQLVDCDSGAHLWAETYDREFDANAQFELLDDLVPQIVSSIADLHGVLLRCVSEVLRGADPATLTPYAAVLRSFAYLQRPNAEEHRLTREALESALERSPAYADAWAALSLLCHEEFAQGFNIHPNPLDRAHDAARRAIDLAPSNHLAHHALAAVEFFRKEMQRFRLAAARAFELNPMDGSTLAHLGSLLAYAGDWKRGGTLCASARRLNPHHPGWYWFVHGLDAYRNGDCRASLEFADRANMPEAWQTNLLLAAAHAHLGHKAAATKALLALVSQRQDFAEAPRQALSVWWQPEMVEKLMAGLEMAGLRVSARS